MENSNEITYGTVIAALASFGFLCWIIYDLYKSHPILTLVLTIVLLAISVMLILSRFAPTGIDNLERNICRQLDKQGYKHEKQEDTLYVLKNDNRFRVQFADGINKKIKHLYVIYDFGDDDFEKVTSDGWNRAANSINLNNTSIVFVSLSDHFCCCYQSAIESSRDFMPEFNRAYNAIGGALEDYKKLYPYLEQDYPKHTMENKSSIGFK